VCVYDVVIVDVAGVAVVVVVAIRHNGDVARCMYAYAECYSVYLIVFSVGGVVIVM